MTSTNFTISVDAHPDIDIDGDTEGGPTVWDNLPEPVEVRGLEAARRECRRIVLAAPDGRVEELGYSRRAGWVTQTLADIGDIGDPHTKALITEDGGTLDLPNGTQVTVARVA